MNFLIFGNGKLISSGIEKRIGYEIAELGHKVYLVINEETLYETLSVRKHKNLEFICLSYNKYKFDELYIEEKIDICFGLDQSVSPFVAEYKNRMKVKSFCLFLDFPVHIIDGRDRLNYDFAYSQEFYYWINCALEVDGVFFNTNIAIEEFKKRYNKEGYLISYPIVFDDAYEHFNRKVPNKDFTIGCHKLWPYKGTIFTLKALEGLGYNYSHLYSLVEKHEGNRLNKVARYANLDIDFYEKVSEYKKMEMMYNARLLIYPQITHWIGGISIIEAMSVKTPSVCFNYPILKELFGESVLYAKAENVEDLRKKIQILYKDNELNKELSEKGYKRFKDCFTIEHFVQNLLKYF